ncbi:MAG: UDP-N-acetylglucosamine 1-carboxyvinyltransferase [Candidatus Sericytochromatia bacterium]|nr:UDP-N-acetylglucosamine 1-carboxyvinyltransferase [Candidatus Sericytochromatia bacterium]
MKPNTMNLERLIIQGGTPLCGNVAIYGAKNSALVLMAAAVLGKQDIIVLENTPRLADIEIMADVLRSLGAKVRFTEHHTLEIDPREINKTMAPYELVTKMRASFFVLGPLLARMGEARVSLPGGCAIGSRPVDIHLKGLEAMGATIEIEHGDVIAQADKLVGADIHLNFPSVGATENLMMAASLAEGTTRLYNAAREPEIIDLANFLKAMGAKIEGAGSDTIIIEGVKDLKQPVYYSVMPDRIEAGTFMIAAAITKGDVILERAPVHELESLSVKLREANVMIETIDHQTLRVQGRRPILATDVRTMPHPGFPTDMQAQFAAMMALAHGTSRITETVFENRFMYVDELQRMGANIRIEGNTATIVGQPRLSGAPVQATDLRAAAALVLAGLVADGETIVSNLFYLDRGYEAFEKRLAQLGARTCRISTSAQKSEAIGTY